MRSNKARETRGLGLAQARLALWIATDTCVHTRPNPVLPFDKLDFLLAT